VSPRTAWKHRLDRDWHGTCISLRAATAAPIERSL
jgi:hypothetical protein